MYSAIAGQRDGTGASRRIGGGGVLRLSAVLAFLCTPAFAGAQRTNEPTMPTDAPGSAFEYSTDKEGSATKDQRVDPEQLFWESELRRHEVEGRLSAENIRSRLAELWQGAGFASTDAHVLAAMYEPAESGAAVIASTRSKGIVAAMLDLKAAIDTQNYLLANQLLIALIIVGHEEGNKAAIEQSRAPEARTAVTGTGRPGVERH